ncbi:hypothetical protein GA0074695_0290 [Micromonospora viridifaciens]|uniref:Uncharacterized protein n=1 Tax=Micromonospora viridifaciens TaxID=1881 RepID=A0A1C4U9Y5_MICVI|nr:hypothetical protein [Micromonospora viridifaciens]SCE68456.1 hypothetical protein GA0074695_0290 [Micromonospora viridifaciens]
MSEAAGGPGAPVAGHRRSVPPGGYRRLIGAHRAAGLAGPSRGYLFTVALLAGTASMPILAAFSTGSATVGSSALPDTSTPFIPTPSVGPVVLPLPDGTQPPALPSGAPVATGRSWPVSALGPAPALPDDRDLSSHRRSRPAVPAPAPGRTTPTVSPRPRRGPTPAPSPSASGPATPDPSPTLTGQPTSTFSEPPTDPPVTTGPAPTRSESTGATPPTGGPAEPPTTATPAVGVSAAVGLSAAVGVSAAVGLSAAVGVSAAVGLSAAVGVSAAAGPSDSARGRADRRSGTPRWGGVRPGRR